MPSEQRNSLWRIVREQVRERSLRWLAHQLQPYLEPGTVISHVNVQNYGQAPAFQVTNDGIILGKGTRMNGSSS